jgi:NhaP-type Na+/H+ and K+/H+ antiporter
MFVVLGLLVFPHELGAVALSGLALAALLVLLIRPIAVWVSTAAGGRRTQLPRPDRVRPRAPDYAISGSAVRDLGLPRTALVAVVARGDETIPPRGSTMIQPSDRLFVLAPRAMRPEIEERLRPLASAGVAAPDQLRARDLVSEVGRAYQPGLIRATMPRGRACGLTVTPLPTVRPLSARPRCLEPVYL